MREREVMQSFTVLGNTAVRHEEKLQHWASRAVDVHWTVSRNAKVGDEVFFYITSPCSSLVARGVVKTWPQREVSGQYPNHWWSQIGSLQMLPRMLPIRELREVIPGWGWLKSPIGSCEIPFGAVTKLEKLIATTKTQRRKTASNPLPKVQKSKPSVLQRT